MTPERFGQVEELYQAASQLMMSWLHGDQGATAPRRQKRPSRSHRKPYPTDLAEARWKEVAPLLRPAKAGGRPRTTDLREIVNALLYLAASGGSWRMLPHDFGGWQTESHAPN